MQLDFGKLEIQRVDVSDKTRLSAVKDLPELIQMQ